MTYKLPAEGNQKSISWIQLICQKLKDNFWPVLQEQFLKTCFGLLVNDSYLRDKSSSLENENSFKFH